MGRISRKPDLGDAVPYFSSVKLERLPGIRNAWHPFKIDYSDLTVVDKLDDKEPWTISEKEQLVTTPHFPGEPVYMKLAQFPREIGAIENETAVCQHIVDKGIAPRYR